MKNRQLGFSLVEVLIATAIFIAIGFVTVGVMRGFVHQLSASETGEGGTLTLEQQLDDLRSGAATAFAVFVPDLDIHKRPNAYPVHEVDYYSKTDTGKPVFWAYYFDKTASTLRRYDYDLFGNVGTADRSTGAIVARQHYAALADVIAFDARAIQADKLVDPQSSLYGAALAPLFSAAGAAPKPLPVGFDDGNPAQNDIYGGNTTVQVSISTKHTSRYVHLATAALPSGFTVHVNPQFRAIVWRSDSTHRSFPFISHSHVYVMARVVVSYDNWKSKPTLWCEWPIYGYPEGLIAPFKNRADLYNPSWFEESTAGMIYAIRTPGATPGVKCDPSPPLPANIAVTPLYTPPPQLIDTPNP